MLAGRHALIRKRRQGPRWGQERGASMLEYVLLLALIAVVIIAAAMVLGDETSARFDCAGESIPARANECD